MQLKVSGQISDSANFFFYLLNVRQVNKYIKSSLQAYLNKVCICSARFPYIKVGITSQDGGNDSDPDSVGQLMKWPTDQTLSSFHPKRNGQLRRV